jgi:adenylate kinases
MQGILLIGPQGSGKGTQAIQIAKKYDIPHISTGDLFRKHISEQTELGQLLGSFVNQGQLVPDDVTLELVKDRLAQPDCKHGYLLDGFPRNLVQAEMLDALLKELGMSLTNIICLEMARELLIERLEGRRTCEECGKIYHVKYNPPKVDGICDTDGGKLLQRDDDTEEKINLRLNDYYNQTEPVLDYYREKGLVQDVDATLEISEVFGKIQEVLNND